MQVYTNIADLPQFKHAVLTIGTFDGVHLGHAKIISQLLSEAKKVSGTAVLITFYPHPKQVVENNSSPVYILSTQQEKYELLEKKGIEHIVVIPFDKTFAEQPALNYIKDFLVDRFHPHTIIIGYDHRFGKNRQGNFELLEQEAKQYNYNVKEIPEKFIHDVIISSTKVRKALLDGDTIVAAEYLGYDYFFAGKVVEGNKLGRTIGYPTANLYIDDAQKLIPANGVYAVYVECLSGEFDGIKKGMMNIGYRPTVNGRQRTVEVNIFDFDDQVYGSTLKITLKQRLRSEVKFKGLKELTAQLANDEKEARKLLF